MINCIIINETLCDCCRYFRPKRQTSMTERTSPDSFTVFTHSGMDFIFPFSLQIFESSNLFDTHFITADYAGQSYVLLT